MSFTPSAAQLGSSNLVARVEDAGGLSDNQGFTIEVRQALAVAPENAAPSLDPIANQLVLVGNSLGVQTSASDADAGDSLVYTLPLAPAGMTINTDGLIGFTPIADQVGLHDVTVQVADNLGAVALQSFIVTVKPINRAPIAVDNLYDARIGETTSISAPGALANDSDPDGDALTAALVSNVANGVLDFRNDGSFDYTPGLPEQTGPVELELQCEPPLEYVTNSTIATGDVDNDGEVELVGVNFWRSNLYAEPWVLNGADCTPEPMPSIALQAAGGFAQGTHPGLLDIDGDGDLEIIGIRDGIPGVGSDGDHLIAVHHDGNLAWTGDGASETMSVDDTVGNSSAGAFNQMGPTFADIDANGTVEIIMPWYRSAGIGGGVIQGGVTVFNSADGTILWEFLTGQLQFGDSDYKPPLVADIDLDGTMEIIYHTNVVSHLGVLEFVLPVQPSLGYSTHLATAVANFDDDPYAEIIAIDQDNHYLFNHDGSVIFQNPVNNNSGSQITVADFDGDNEVEYAWYNGLGSTATRGYFQVYETDGSLLWSHQGLNEFGEELTRFKGVNATAFDANNDGALDLIVHLNVYTPVTEDVDGVYIFDGRDGSVLEFVQIGSNSREQRFTTIADIDNDGKAEIISSRTNGLQRETRVWQGTSANPLPPAPSTRNQWIYNQSIVDDFTGKIITDPTPQWLQPGKNGYNMVSDPNKIYLAEKCSLNYQGFGVSTAFTNGTMLSGDVDNDGDIELVGWNGIFPTNPRSGLFVINGEDCSPQLEGSPDIVAAGQFHAEIRSHLGLADLDGDGDLEIIGKRRNESIGVPERRVTLLAANHDGTLFSGWGTDGASESSQVVTDDISVGTGPGPSFADIDADGALDIIVYWEEDRTPQASLNTGGVTVFNGSDGTIKWELDSLPRRQLSSHAPVVIADLDIDGTMEIIVDRSVISHDGVVEYVLPVELDGSGNADHLFTAVANFDTDPFAEIIAHDEFNHYLFDHEGNVVWQIARPDLSESQITVGDFDGDGQVEYALQRGFLQAHICGAQTGYMAVYEADGSPVWDHQTIEPYLSTCGFAVNHPVATAFDANGDGAHDLVIHHRGDNQTTDRNGLYIFDGKDGSLLRKVEFPAIAESYRSVTIADVDNDDAAEIVLSWFGSIAGDTVILEGIEGKPLPPAPPIVNQQFMHRGLVGDSGQILTNPVPHWLQPGANGFLAIPLQPDPLAGTTDSFTYLASDGPLNSNVATVTFDVQPAGVAPVFLTQPDTLTTVGFPYEYAPRVFDADPGDSVSFTLAAAPAGMTMTSNGRLNWLPDAEGSYQVSIIASDTIGFSTPQSFTLLVGQPVVVPDVVGQAQASAESALTGVNLLTGDVRSSTHPTISAGSVFEQSPIAGSVAEFGSNVDLFVSTGPAPEDIDDDNDGLSENEGDCDDGNDAIGPGATDPVGDGIDQDCDGIDGNLVLTDILVSPAIFDRACQSGREPYSDRHLRRWHEPEPDRCRWMDQWSFLQLGHGRHVHFDRIPRRHQWIGDDCRCRPCGW